MAAGWLLLSIIQCAFEHAAPTAIPAGRQPASRVAATSSPLLLTLQFHRLHLQGGEYAFAKDEGLGSFDPFDAPPRALLCPGGQVPLSTPTILARSWQFRLRAALNPRAPCLS